MVLVPIDLLSMVSCNKAEAQIVVAIVGLVVVAISSTQVLAVVVPAAATHHALVALLTHHTPFVLYSAEHVFTPQYWLGVASNGDATANSHPAEPLPIAHQHFAAGHWR